MKKARVLFVSQEITPYLDETPMGYIARYLPQGIQEKGKEIRTFMPRYGCINERRNQLHEVIRLSGMNLIINDTDHPLIIKVASIQAARMQVYFIDNEEYFQRKMVLTDKKGAYFEDNDERMIFFARGVIETVKKLGWAPDIVHCHGWFTGLMPLYLKKAFRDNPLFAETRVIYSVYEEEFPNQLNKNFAKKILIDGIEKSDVEQVAKLPNFVNLNKLAIDYSDAVIKGSEKINPDVEKYIKKSGKNSLDFKSREEYIAAYSEFYDAVLAEEPLLVD
ncbi:MAG TPA: glycogen/starch synthase [Bacteroidia bacterium]|nr:glycogen/starch synthase [Bacteroidia bacterium]